MSKSALTSLIIFLSIMLFSCNGTKDNSRDAEVKSLYIQSRDLALNYTDSIRNAKDSIEVKRLSDSFEDALTKLNYSFPPDLGLEISEARNDTLSHLILNFASLRDARLKDFHLAVDTIKVETEDIVAGLD